MVASKFLPLAGLVRCSELLECSHVVKLHSLAMFKGSKYISWLGNAQHFWTMLLAIFVVGFFHLD